MQHEGSLKVIDGNIVTNGQYVIPEPKINPTVSTIW